MYGENEEKFEIIFDNKILQNKIKLNFNDISFYLGRELWKLKDSNSSITYNQKTKEFNLTNLFLEGENQFIKTDFRFKSIDNFDLKLITKILNSINFYQKTKKLI